MKLLQFFITILLLGSITFAENNPTPFRATLKKRIELRELIFNHVSTRQGKNLVESIKPVYINTSIFGIGNVTIKLDRKWLPAGEKFFDNGLGLNTDENDPIFLRGEIRLREQTSQSRRKKRVRYPLTATIYNAKNKHTKIKLFLKTRDIFARYKSLESSLNNGSSERILRIRNVNNLALKNLLCAAENSGKSLYDTNQSAYTAVTSRDISTSAAYRIIDFSTESDKEWFDAYGNNSNTEILSLINNAEAIYEPQLGLTFNIIKQVTTTTNRYSSSNAEILLASFADFTLTNNHLGSADLYHLFTGKDVYTVDENTHTNDFRTIGLAYYTVDNSNNVHGTVCLAPSLSFGLTENFDSLINYIITAHEVGHNFGATHDLVNTTSIMGTELNNFDPPTQFSNTSKQQISSHINNFGSCLSSSNATPTGTPSPTPTSPSNPTPLPGTTPSATPTKSSGGKGGNGELTPSPDSPLHLIASLDKNGSFSTSISLDTLTDSSCTVSLKANDNYVKVNKGKLLVTRDSQSLPFSYTASISKKAQKKNKKGKNIKIYLRAIESCQDGTVNYSEIRNIVPSKTTVSGKAVSAKSWIKSLQSLLLNAD